MASQYLRSGCLLRAGIAKPAAADRAARATGAGHRGQQQLGQGAVGADVTLDVIEGAGHGGPQFITAEKLKRMYEFLAKHWAG